MSDFPQGFRYWLKTIYTPTEFPELMRIYGHRFARGLGPENTLSAFRTARPYLDGVEFDLWKCKSGEIVAFHDRELHEVSTILGNIDELTWDELAPVEVFGRTEYRFSQSCKIPSFTQILAEVDVPLNIELKGPGVAAPAAALVKAAVEQGARHYEEFTVSSFDHEQLEEFFSYVPEVKAGALFERRYCSRRSPFKLWQSFSPRKAYAQLPFIKTINPPYEFTTRGMVNEIHDLGLEAWVWTVNAEKDFERMGRCGVDCIITDYPDRAYRFFNGQKE